MAAHANAQLSVLRAAAPAWQTEDRALPPPESDAALVAGVLAGDIASKEQLYRRHVRYIAGMSSRLLRSRDGAEDIVQDTFAIAFAKIDTLRTPEAFRGWLASIAVSQIHRLLARQRLLRLVGLDRSLDDAPLDALARHDCPLEARSELAALDTVLRQLPPKQRIAWMLRYVEGEPLDAVAEACRCSRATVKRWIAAADARVREHVSIARVEEAS